MMTVITLRLEVFNHSDVCVCVYVSLFLCLFVCRSVWMGRAKSINYLDVHAGCNYVVERNQLFSRQVSFECVQKKFVLLKQI